jgi:hypothetical protein
VKKPSNCPICTSEKVVSLWWASHIHMCESCDLHFNDITQDVDYENDDRFSEDQALISRYKKYAQRDFDLIRSELNDELRILEIGAGYGFLSLLIRREFSGIEYYYLERNRNLKSLYASRGDNVIESVQSSLSPDVILMAHCLEHIKDAPRFLFDILNVCPSAKLILFQTNPQGLIPKWLPWLWYGWSLDQHYYHFSIKSLTLLADRAGLSLSKIKYYKLHQEPAFSLKGIVKFFLSVVNVFVTGRRMDAYMVCFDRKPS